jgi:hypothetical protein
MANLIPVCGIKLYNSAFYVFKVPRATKGRKNPRDMYLQLNSSGINLEIKQE